MEKSLSNVIVFALLFFASCGRHVIRPEIDSEFKSYVSRFSNVHRITIKSDVVFGKLSNIKFVGFCTRLSNGKSKVEIDKDYWNRASVAQKELLIFHELGHCELGLPHNDRMMFGNFCPETLMYFHTFSHEQAQLCFLPNRQYYLENL
jgi:hypothetical protein